MESVHEGTRGGLRQDPRDTPNREGKADTLLIPSKSGEINREKRADAGLNVGEEEIEPINAAQCPGRRRVILRIGHARPRWHSRSYFLPFVLPAARSAIAIDWRIAAGLLTGWLLPIVPVLSNLWTNSLMLLLMMSLLRPRLSGILMLPKVLELAKYPQFARPSVRPRSCANRRPVLSVAESRQTPSGPAQQDFLASKSEGP
jgi:hypothetical protein